MSSELNALQTRLEQLERNNARIQAANTQMQSQFQQAESRYILAQRRLRVQASLAFLTFLVAVFAFPGSRTAIAQGTGLSLDALNLRLMAVEAKTQFQSADATAKSTTFSGCNVIVNNGSGFTPAPVTNAAGQGLGNLIVGYNALRGNGNIRTGSHNLILGDQNNYLSYGGLVAGYSNTISGPFACVSGGYLNTASGQVASVSGGAQNTASGYAASVSGGNFNTASVAYASVSGGNINLASGFASSVSGGNFNTASGAFAAVNGGNSNTAKGDNASVSGGVNNMASGGSASVSGGVYNTASGQVASVSGGIYLVQPNNYGWSAGGNGGAGLIHSP